LRKLISPLYTSSPPMRGAEIVRQQWNFSPQGSITEVEDYAVDLEGLSVLELAICPDIGKRDGVASLAAIFIK
jgi:hypothetical protein